MAPMLILALVIFGGAVAMRKYFVIGYIVYAGLVMAVLLLLYLKWVYNLMVKGPSGQTGWVTFHADVHKWGMMPPAWAWDWWVPPAHVAHDAHDAHAAHVAHDATNLGLERVPSKVRHGDLRGVLRAPRGGSVHGASHPRWRSVPNVCSSPGSSPMKNSYAWVSFCALVLSSLQRQYQPHTPHPVTLVLPTVNTPRGFAELSGAGQGAGMNTGCTSTQQCAMQGAQPRYLPCTVPWHAGGPATVYALHCSLADQTQSTILGLW